MPIVSIELTGGIFLSSRHLVNIRHTNHSYNRLNPPESATDRPCHAIGVNPRAWPRSGRYLGRPEVERGDCTMRIMLTVLGEPGDRDVVIDGDDSVTVARVSEALSDHGPLAKVVRLPGARAPYGLSAEGAT